MEKVLSGITAIYISGIGGIGTSGLALLLRERGFLVRGSDVSDSYAVRMLTSAGISVDIGHAPNNIGPEVQLLVYSSAVKEDNPELIEARRRGIAILKRGELLGLLCEGQKTVAICGSHGKTTTTALMGHLLTSLGLFPTVCVGGVALNCGRNAWWGKDYFVVETDESDGSFLYCKPWSSIITNIDSEHLDYHKTMAHLKENFLRFARNTGGKVFGCGDDASVRIILDKVGGISYGFGEHNVVRATQFSFDGTCSVFEVIIEGKSIGVVRVPLLGEHNALNTLAVLGFFYYHGLDVTGALGALSTFKGTKRRFQIKEVVSGVTFVDDYAHHPTEINAVLKAARLLSCRRLVAVFQPHRFSRVKQLCVEFSQCFAHADEVILTDVYAASETKIEGIDALFLLDHIKKFFPQGARYIARERIVEELPMLLQEGDLVMGLGAGDINTIMEEVISGYKKNRVSAGR
ncbi:MAG: UDP-N-acetylmuramate--L-alanine ligase [Candidatus Omnitrophota bacterium]|nr:UDP-N-acetylmuramate--L-alanine ligase [Candidatus Omnitrophota bacterium]